MDIELITCLVPLKDLPVVYIAKCILYIFQLLVICLKCWLIKLRNLINFWSSYLFLVMIQLSRSLFVTWYQSSRFRSIHHSSLSCAGPSLLLRGWPRWSYIFLGFFIHTIIIFEVWRNNITIRLFWSIPLQLFASHKNATEYVWGWLGPSCRHIRQRVFSYGLKCPRLPIHSSPSHVHSRHPVFYPIWLASQDTGIWMPCKLRCKTLMHLKNSSLLHIYSSSLFFLQRLLQFILI